MNKKLLLCYIICSIFIVSIYGCLEDDIDNGNGTATKTVEMTASEFAQDIDFSMGLDGGYSTITGNYKYLNDGDTLILTDQIDNITYDNFFLRASIITFHVDNYTTLFGTSNKERLNIE